jgi:hypothetical protein
VPLQVEKVPDSVPQRGPQIANGGPLSLDCGVWEQRTREEDTDQIPKKRLLNTLQWNIKGVLNKENESHP